MNPHAIRFIHNDDTLHKFQADKNKLTEDYLYTFNDWRTAYVSDRAGINDIVRNILKSAKRIISNDFTL